MKKYREQNERIKNLIRIKECEFNTDKIVVDLIIRQKITEDTINVLREVL